MMKWGMNQIAGLSSIAKRFLGIEDPDLLILLDRLKQLEDAYINIEKCCHDVCELANHFSKSLSVISGDLESISQKIKNSKEAPQFRAHVEYTQNEYVKFVKSKIDIEAKETLLNEMKEKRQVIDDLKNRISDCSQYCNEYTDMKLQIAHIKDRNDVDPSVLEEFSKLETIVNQQKLQLQSDVHFLIEKESVFVQQSSDIIKNMLQRSLSHNASLLQKEPPRYILYPDQPFVEGKEDSEIDFVVSSRGYHILPLSIKNNRELIWSINTFGEEIDFRVLYRDEKMNETLIEPMHRIGNTQGSYIGVGTGMLELLFDNQFSLFKGKKIHVRLGTLDKVDSEEESCCCLL